MNTATEEKRGGPVTSSSPPGPANETADSITKGNDGSKPSEVVREKKKEKKKKDGARSSRCGDYLVQGNGVRGEVKEGYEAVKKAIESMFECGNTFGETGLQVSFIV